MTAVPKPVFTEIAAVDLGSNSFRLQMARVADDQLLYHDSLREMVRLGSGLGRDKMLDEASMKRAVECLKRFGERLRGLPPQAVRAVATNTFRVAKNAPQLLEEAQAALGFPIEIIAGREEARMIFVGVAHSLPASPNTRLVVDIGGGSTECILGSGLTPREMESLYMGCVSYSMRYFGDGKLSETNLKKAEIAARSELQAISAHFAAGHWQEAVGSSGTARALGEILRLNGWSDGSITRQGLAKLRTAMLKAKDVKKLQLQGLSEERSLVFPGGFSIMSAVFAELGVESMAVASGALREGVLHELLGRMHHHDTRDATVRQFMRRYHVDSQQVRRVQGLALNLLRQIAPRLQMAATEAWHYLTWAARLHEIGVSIAHTGYHKHSAYIVENADMQGFSKKEQQLLALLVRTQRRSLGKVGVPPLPDDRVALMVVLRLAVLFHRNRTDHVLPNLDLALQRNGFQLRIEQGWLRNNPLTEAELAAETAFLKEVGIGLEIAEG